MMPVSLMAQEETATIDTGDTAWLMTSIALVLVMTPGLALFYSGMARRKNVLGTMMHSYIMMGVVSVIWVLYGYSLAFHEGSFWGGFNWAFLRGVGQDPDPYGYASTVPHQAFMAFQLMFAIITAALITGAFAERMKFKALLLFTVLWSTFIYFPLAHWVWGSGGLLRYGDDGAIFGALDFAGGTVVHISSGVSALVLAVMIGKRVGYGKEPILPHNLSLTVLGAGLLWFGWFGFNGGSALSSGGLAVSALVVTNFAAAAAMLAWIFAEWIFQGKPTVLGAVSGAVAGLVGITPAAGFVGPMAALLIGAAAGLACFWAVLYLKPKLGYDDSLDVFGIHGIGGTTGALLTGVLASTAVNDGGADGLFYGNTSLMYNQVMAILATWAFVGLGTFIIAKLVDVTVGLRVSEEEERSGLDQSQHGESGYNFE